MKPKTRPYRRIVYNVKMIVLLITVGLLTYSCTVNQATKKRQGYKYSSRMMNR